MYSFDYSKVFNWVIIYEYKTLKKTKLYVPLLWMGFNWPKASATSRRQFAFYHYVPKHSWYSFYRPRKNEGLGRPWSHPWSHPVSHTGPLDWKASVLTTKSCTKANMETSFLVYVYKHGNCSWYIWVVGFHHCIFNYVIQTSKNLKINDK